MHCLKKHWFEALLILLGLYLVYGIAKTISSAATAAENVASQFNPLNIWSSIKGYFSKLFTGLESKVSNSFAATSQAPSIQQIVPPVTGPVSAFINQNPDQLNLQPAGNFDLSQIGF